MLALVLASSWVSGHGGRHPLAPFVLRATKQIERPPQDPVPGVEAPYTIAMPNSSWWLRVAAAAKKDNALSDRWLTRPDLDAHILIIAENLAGKYIHPARYAEIVREHMRESSTNLQVLKEEPWSNYPQQGRLLHVRFERSGQKIEAYMATIGGFGLGIQVMAFASTGVFSSVEPELLKALASFKAPPSMFSAVPPEGYEPMPRGGRVVGLLRPYELTAPPKAWFLKKDAETKAANPEVDRWIYRPDVDLSVLVVAEKLPKGTDVETYAEAGETVLSRHSQGLEVVDRSVASWDPEHARVVHARWSVDGVNVEGYLVAVVSEGWGYLLHGISDRRDFESRHAELWSVLSSFRAPSR